MEAIAPRHALPSNATAHDLYSHWYPLYAKLHRLAAACEHMRRSCCPRRVESERYSCVRAYLAARGLKPSTPSKSSEHEGRVTAFDLHHLRVGVVQRSFLRKPNADTVLQRCKLFARGLQWALQVTCLQCRLR